MLPNLTPFFKQPYQAYARGVSLQSSHPTLDFAEFITSAHFVDHVTHFSRQQGVMRPRAQASVWHMHYTLSIFPSIIVSQSLLKISLPLQLHELSYEPKHMRILLPSQGSECLMDNTDSRYRGLLFDHLSPLHDCLQEQFGVKKRTLWSNCFYRLNDLFETIVQIVGPHPTLVTDRQILNHADNIAQLNNPLKFKTITCHDKNGHYQLRPECCLLHQREDGSYCHDCPKHKHHMHHVKARRHKTR
ncbi:siderophore-iron reductase FhuF [Pseudoalteromonas piscicida]|uniref:Siderophore-iron reductase FhuF n=1 Tax=Pseudoalteromonas piscicida TaxID=43662 RepID=A0A2A5JW68_PSEO7|nr:siderophore-iron reductase FhuF [Pseudoalteromonas piscicida]